MPNELITSFFKPKQKAEPESSAETVNAVASKPGSKRKHSTDETIGAISESQKSLKITPYDPRLHKKDLRLFHQIYPKKQKADRWLSANGYFFYATNNFTEFQVVSMIHRYVPSLNKTVGVNFRVATASLDADGALTNIEVNEHFRRQGIGSELVRFIKNAVKQFTVFAGDGENSRYRLTGEGAELINACLERNILKSNQVIANEVPASPYLTPVSP